MKIIDFERRGNVVRFYLGEDDLETWYGDDWGDYPYEHNASKVYNEFISKTIDVAFSYTSLVLEPQNDWRNGGNSQWCKDDMREGLVPCIVVVPHPTYEDDFTRYVGMRDAIRIYFGDDEELLRNISEATILSEDDYE